MCFPAALADLEGSLAESHSICILLNTTTRWTCTAAHVHVPVQESRPHGLLKKKSSPDVLFRSLQHAELQPLLFEPSATHPQPSHSRHQRTVGFDLSPHAESPQTSNGHNGTHEQLQVPSENGSEASEADRSATSPGWVPCCCSGHPISAVRVITL